MEASEAQKRRAIEQHSIQADQFAAHYRALGLDGYQNCFVYSRRRLDSWLRLFLPARGGRLRLLDVGCGTGHHMASLRDRGFDVAGVDGSAEMIAHAQENNPGADIRQADVEQLPFASCSFDYVLCIEVLRYLPDASRCLTELARVLRPGGVCLATAAPLLSLNGYWLVNRIAARVPLGGLVQLKQFFNTSYGLRNEFTQAGFLHPEIHGVYFGPINWWERLLPHAIPRLLRAWEPVDEMLADRPVLRELSNMFLVRAVRRQSLIP